MRCGLALGLLNLKCRYCFTRVCYKSSMMHKDDLPIDEATVSKLLSMQAPQWVDLPIRRLDTSGTDNAMFRLGDRLVFRIPRRESAVQAISKELNWLPRLDNLPLEIPTLRLRGRADVGVSCEFGVFDWIEGEIGSLENLSDAAKSAASLARFLRALQTKSTDGAPAAGPLNSRRGVPLSQMSDVMLPAIEIVSDEIDASAAREVWNSAVKEKSSRPPVWVHGDLKADNLIANGGELSGVIDWGLSAVGDPAADYAAAWSWVAPSARATFRNVLELDDCDWLRAKGWALYGAVIALSYYRRGRNEALCRQSRLTLSRLNLM